MSSSIFTVMGLLLAVAFNVSAADGQPGKWIGGKIATGGKGGDREYRIYVPTSYRGAPMPLVVMLHGCNQNPDIFAESTRMNNQAESGQFLVLYPAQKVSSNPTRCWNWFLPENQARDSGEPAEIVTMMRRLSEQYAVDPKRVYVAGLSAGASMSAILAACYPDIFAAAGIHDGTMYKSATTLAEAGKVMATGKAPDPKTLGTQAWACGGKRRLMMPVTIWHGQGDNIVNRDAGDQLVLQFAKLNDWADDGQENGSTPQGPVTQPGQSPGGYTYTVATYTHQGHPLIQYYQVAKMGHAWSGGKDDMMFSDAKGPDASLLMWNFFKQFSR